jgi:serine/threonine protein kinase
MRQLIQYQKNNKNSLNYMCHLRSYETLTQEQTDAITRQATLLGKNIRHRIYRKNDELIKVQRHTGQQITHVTVQTYEPNFGTLEGLLTVFERGIDNMNAEKYAAAILMKVIQLVYKIHRSEWFHNDIKPANILVCPLSKKDWPPFKAAQEKLFLLQDEQSRLRTNYASFSLFDINLMNDESIESVSKKAQCARTMFLEKIFFKNKFRLKICDFEFMTTDINRKIIHGTHLYMSSNQLWSLEQKTAIFSNNPSCDLHSLGMIILQTLTYENWSEYQSSRKKSYARFQDEATSKLLQYKTSSKQLRAKASTLQFNAPLQKLLHLALSLTDSCAEHRLNSFEQFNRKRTTHIFSCCFGKKPKNMYEEPLLDQLEDRNNKKKFIL